VVPTQAKNRVMQTTENKVREAMVNPTNGKRKEKNREVEGMQPHPGSDWAHL
jgi:hypothetical protein